MDIGVSSKTYADSAGPATFATLARLNTMLAGTAPLEVAVELEPEPPEAAVFGFTTNDGDTMLGIWSDVAVVHPADLQPIRLTVPGMAGTTAEAIDVVGGVQQALNVDNVDGDLVIEDLLVGQQPLLVRLATG